MVTKSHDRDRAPGASPRKARHADLARLVSDLEAHEQELRQQSAQLLETRQALEDALDRYAELYDFAPFAYVTLDATGIVQEINLTGATLLGRTRTQLIGRPLVPLIWPEDRRRFLDHLRRCRSETAPITTEMRLALSSDVTPVQLVSRRSLARPVGAEAYYTAIIDLGDVKRLERERAEAERARQESVNAERLARASSDAKDRFLAVLSHELRTPLTPVVAAVDALAGLHKLPSQVASNLEIIRRNVQMAHRLVDDLLDIARISQKRLAVRREAVDLHCVINEALDTSISALPAARPVCRLELRATRHHVMGDATRLQQVFCNVINNALKFTEASGTIRIQSSNVDHTVRVGVSDTGQGMEGETLASVFLPFAQDRSERERSRGFGLGLAICKGLVDAHGGEIRVTSGGIGQGTTVEINLPVADRPPIPNPKPLKAPQKRSRRRFRILLVDDHEDTVTMFSRLLTAKGHKVSTAGSVGEALPLVGSCDLIISDIGLPDGSGLDLLAEIRRTSAVPAIALSGYGAEQDVQKALQAGFAEHLTKPVDLNYLMEVIERILAGGGRGQE